MAVAAKRKKRELIQAKTLDAEQIGRILSQMGRRFVPLHEAMRSRESHVFARSETAVTLDEPLDDVDYQSTAPFLTWTRAKARLAENHWVAQVTPPRDVGTLQTHANILEQILNSFGALIEERHGVEWQDALADGQLVTAYGVLMWRDAWELWPDVPEYEFTGELPEDAKERSRYRETREEEGEHEGQYRETDESLQKRYVRLRAQAGCPIDVTVPTADSVMFVPDKAGAIAMAARVASVSVFDYNDTLRASKDGVKVVFDDMAKLRVYADDKAPRGLDPSYDQKSITVVEFWTRNEFYELIRGESLTEVVEEGAAKTVTYREGTWEIVKSGKHYWGCVPMAFAWGSRYNHHDPLYAYVPLMETIFRVKAQLDRVMNLIIGIAERIALPEVFFVAVNEQADPMADPNTGKVKLFKDSAEAEALPAGWKLEKLEFDLNAAVVQLAQELKAEMEQSVSTLTSGGEIDAKTAPWTARLLIQVADAVPKKALKNQGLAIRAMLRSWVHRMSLDAESGGFPQPLAAFRRTKDGREDPRETVSIEPKDIPGLQVDVSIPAESAAERITKIEHGRTLLTNADALGQPMPLITHEEFDDDYLGVENATEHQVELLVEKLVREQVVPGLLKQEIAKLYGNRYVIGVDMQLTGFDGAMVDSAALLAASDQAGLVPPPPQQAVMPGLVDQGPPEVMPQPTLGVM